MDNSEEILQCLEEFSKLRPKIIPRELEEYLCYVAQTGDPVYQWPTIKYLFREKLINVLTEYYESFPTAEIPPCPNVDVFNYDNMKRFILEKLDTFSAAPFTIQRICELLTNPHKEYNRIDKYMRAFEKNILVVSTTEPCLRRNAENGEGIVNGLEGEHATETNNSNNDINVEDIEMDETPNWPRVSASEHLTYTNNSTSDSPTSQTTETVQETYVSDAQSTETACSSSVDTVITCRPQEQPYVSIEPVVSDSCIRDEGNVVEESDLTITITAIPPNIQKCPENLEPVVSSDEQMPQQTTDFLTAETTESKTNTESIIDSASSEDIEDAIVSTCQESESAVAIDSTSSTEGEVEVEPGDTTIETSEVIIKSPVQISTTTNEVLSDENEETNLEEASEPDTVTACDIPDEPEANSVDIDETTEITTTVLPIEEEERCIKESPEELKDALISSTEDEITIQPENISEEILREDISDERPEESKQVDDDSPVVSNSNLEEELTSTSDGNDPIDIEKEQPKAEISEVISSNTVADESYMDTDSENVIQKPCSPKPE